MVNMEGVSSYDIHCHLGQIEIGANASGSGDSGGVQDIPDHGHSQFPCGHFVERQVMGDIDEHLIDGIDMDVIRGDILEIDMVNSGAVVHIEPHTGRRDNIR